MAGEKMAGNVKCIRRHVAALPLLAGTALGAKNGDVGGLGRLPAIEGFWWAVMLAGNRGSMFSTPHAASHPMFSGLRGPFGMKNESPP